MKTKLTALALIAVTALSLAPKPAAASDKTLAVIGGFIGGVLVASELNRNNHGYGHDYAPVVVVNDRCDDGYWREVSFRVWVDGRWVVDGCDHRGREIRRYIGGHYEIRTNREWVSYERHERYGRHDREVSYGYRR
ncbi:MAG: hypothetical protein PSW75_02400 [bacterium]|nr:hypothetical protein [bacterium]MDI1337626.1 hypothetical protein [Lacunisphaera sp.]